MSIRSLFLLLFLGASSLGHAEANSWQLPGNESLLKSIPLPPAEDTPAARADLDYVVALQAHPSKADLAHAEKSVTFTVFTFSEVRGDSFTAAAYPKTAAFFKRLEDTVNPPKNWLKDTIHRERPYKAHPDQVKPLVSIEGGYSCPSGHSMRSWLDALVMADLDPARRSDYLACAAQVNTDRMIGGMHYPSDTTAGRALAETLHEDLLSDSSFKADLEDLRKAEYAR
jgi:acid phosphatase (class A)